MVLTDSEVRYASHFKRPCGARDREVYVEAVRTETVGCVAAEFPVGRVRLPGVVGYVLPDPELGRLAGRQAAGR